MLEKTSFYIKALGAIYLKYRLPSLSESTEPTVTPSKQEEVPDSWTNDKEIDVINFENTDLKLITNKPVQEEIPKAPPPPPPSKVKILTRGVKIK